MPLKKGSSDKTISGNIRSEMHSYDRKGSIGNSKPASRKKAQKQAIAIALNKARESGGGPPKKRSSAKSKSPAAKKTIGAKRTAAKKTTGVKRTAARKTPGATRTAAKKATGARRPAAKTSTSAKRGSAAKKRPGAKRSTAAKKSTGAKPSSGPKNKVAAKRSRAAAPPRDTELIRRDAGESSERVTSNHQPPVNEGIADENGGRATTVGGETDTATSRYSSSGS